MRRQEAYQGGIHPDSGTDPGLSLRRQDHQDLSVEVDDYVDAPVRSPTSMGVWAAEERAELLLDDDEPSSGNIRMGPGVQNGPLGEPGMPWVS